MSHTSVSHNIKEVIDATIAYMLKKKNDVYKASDYIK
jgi:DNA gyrase/topoisomerase IV subunit A